MSNELFIDQAPLVGPEMMTEWGEGGVKLGETILKV